MEAVVEPVGEFVRSSGKEIGTADIADKQCVTREDRSRLPSARGVGDDVGHMLGSVARRLHHPQAQVFDHDLLALNDGFMGKAAVTGAVDGGTGGGGEVNVPGDEIRMQVRLQDMSDAQVHILRGLQVYVNVSPRVHYGAGFAAAEQIGTVGEALHEELLDVHSAPPLRAACSGFMQRPHLRFWCY